MPTSSLQIVQHAAQVLSPQQKKFNTLMQRIGKQRELLRDWEAAIAAFRKRYTVEIEPLRQRDRMLREQLLRLLHGLSDQKLAKADKAHLATVICNYADELLDSEQDDTKIAELKAIYNYHSDVDYDQEQAQMEQDQDTLMREIARQMYGVQFEDDELATPEAVQRKLDEKLQEEGSDTEASDQLDWAEFADQHARERASAKAAKRNAAKALKQQEAEKQVSQSVREIYRKLVSSLHPDREADPVERERKTELMQRVNHAYAAGQLLQLLELQLEVEQINIEHISGLSDERLKHYNQILDGQWREVKREVELVADTFKADFGISPLEQITPKKLATMLTAEVMGRKQNLFALKRQVTLFTEAPDLFNDWLKDSRHFHKGR